MLMGSARHQKPQNRTSRNDHNATSEIRSDNHTSHIHGRIRGTVVWKNIHADTVIIMYILLSTEPLGLVEKSREREDRNFSLSSYAMGVTTRSQKTKQEEDSVEYDEGPEAQSSQDDRGHAPEVMGSQLEGHTTPLGDFGTRIKNVEFAAQSHQYYEPKKMSNYQQFSWSAI